MDNVLLRQSLDVIGWVGFQQDMGGTASLDSSSSAGHCLAITTAAMNEVEQRFREPLRERKFWRKVGILFQIHFKTDLCSYAMDTVASMGPLRGRPVGKN